MGDTKLSTINQQSVQTNESDEKSLLTDYTDELNKIENDSVDKIKLLIKKDENKKLKSIRDTIKKES